MAHIDVTKIEGYAEMSAEDKLKALEGYNIPDPDYSGYVKKDIFDKTASELAGTKKQLKEKMTDDEAAKLKDAEERSTMQAELETLKHKSLVADNKAKLLGLGYEEALAIETAEAMVKGDLEKVFVNQKKHLDSYGKKVLADAVKGTPPPVGDGDKNQSIDYQKKIDEANSAGDVASMAYYTRLAATAEAAAKQ